MTVCFVLALLLEPSSKDSTKTQRESAAITNLASGARQAPGAAWSRTGFRIVAAQGNLLKRYSTAPVMDRGTASRWVISRPRKIRFEPTDVLVNNRVNLAPVAWTG